LLLHELDQAKTEMHFADVLKNSTFLADISEKVRATRRHHIGHRYK
jgi:hypothetical protein